MMRPAPEFEGPCIHVCPWSDPAVDTVGVDPRGRYAELFWLPLLGPSGLWLMRRLVDQLDAQPQGFDFDTVELAVGLGLGPQMHKNGPFKRTLSRLCQFRLARAVSPCALELRRTMPLLTRTQTLRLPPHTQAAHANWVHSQLAQHRARPEPPTAA